MAKDLGQHGSRLRINTSWAITMLDQEYSVHGEPDYCIRIRGVLKSKRKQPESTVCLPCPTGKWPMKASSEKLGPRFFSYTSKLRSHTGRQARSPSKASDGVPRRNAPGSGRALVAWPQGREGSASATHPGTVGMSMIPRQSQAELVLSWPEAHCRLGTTSPPS